MCDNLRAWAQLANVIQSKTYPAPPLYLTKAEYDRVTTMVRVEEDERLIHSLNSDPWSAHTHPVAMMGLPIVIVDATDVRLVQQRELTGRGLSRIILVEETPSFKLWCAHALGVFVYYEQQPGMTDPGMIIIIDTDSIKAVVIADSSHSPLATIEVEV